MGVNRSVGLTFLCCFSFFFQVGLLSDGISHFSLAFIVIKVFVLVQFLMVPLLVVYCNVEDLYGATFTKKYMC